LSDPAEQLARNRLFDVFSAPDLRSDDVLRETLVDVVVTSNLLRSIGANEFECVLVCVDN
jgi:hypothetical protein